MTNTGEILPREPTGIDGLDAVLGGGLFRAGIYMISGSPGTGKTTLANQAAFAHVRRGGRVVYTTLLAETHARMIAYLRQFAFFDESRVGTDFVYLNGFSPLGREGLAGLLKLVRAMVRDHQATMLVIDGIVAAAQIASSEVDYKQFIAELQAWVSAVGCTVLFLRSAGSEPEFIPEQTMVDGIVKLSLENSDLHTVRKLWVTKFRGARQMPGLHAVTIDERGMIVYPRLEATPLPPRQPVDLKRLSTGVPGLDEILCGGLVARSTTLVFGSSGAGKTTLGLQYLNEGAVRGERVLHFSFYEPPDQLLSKAQRFGLSLADHHAKGAFFIERRRAAEVLTDEILGDLIDIITRERITRVFIDGIVGFRSGAHPARLAGIFAAFVDVLSSLGATTMLSDESPDLFVREPRVPSDGLGSVFHNVFLMRLVEGEDRTLRSLAIMKTRDSDYDPRVWSMGVGPAGLHCVEPFASTARSSVAAHAASHPSRRPSSKVGKTKTLRAKTKPKASARPRGKTGKRGVR